MGMEGGVKENDDRALGAFRRVFRPGQWG
jgi:hypothetical protein